MFLSTRHRVSQHGGHFRWKAKESFTADARCATQLTFARFGPLSCCNCEHIFTDGYLTDEAFDILFADSHYIQTVGVDLEHHRYVSSKIVEKVINHVGLSDGSSGSMSGSETAHSC